MTADSMHASHRAHQAGRSRARGCEPEYFDLAEGAVAASKRKDPSRTPLLTGAIGLPARVAPGRGQVQVLSAPTGFLPARSTRHLPRVRGAFYSQIRSGTLPSASVGNMSLPLRNVAGPTALLPEMVGRQFLASSHEPGSQTARDSTDGHPRGPFVGSDPPWLFLSHALKHRSGNVPDQRNVFTFAEIQDGRRT